MSVSVVGVSQYQCWCVSSICCECSVRVSHCELISVRVNLKVSVSVCVSVCMLIQRRLSVRECQCESVWLSVLVGVTIIVSVNEYQHMFVNT